MHQLLNRIELTNRRYRLFKRNDRLLIALSGGPDSVVLMHLLNCLAPKYNLTLSAVHLDHCLREDSSDDREFCRELCRFNRLKFHSKKLDVGLIAQRKKISVELAGRQERYRYFQKICEKYGYTKIATGHTADDSAETFMLNLVRGAHPAGLCGIPAKRDNIIRPLIEIDKNDILEFLKKNSLSYRIDKSNISDKYRRNVIRKKVIPVLQQINKKVQRNISRAAQNIDESMEFFNDKIKELYNLCLVKESNRQIILDLRKLSDYFKYFESWIFLRAYFRLSGESRSPNSEKILQAINLKRRGSVAFLDSGIIAANDSERLILCQRPERLKRIKLQRGKSVKLDKMNLQIKAELVDDIDLNIIKNNDNESVAYLDDDKLGDLLARPLKKGDRFRPLGLKGTKKVADFLNDKGVSVIYKKSVPIIVSGDDIVWVAGYGIDDKFKVDKNTENVLKLQMEIRV